MEKVKAFFESLAKTVGKFLLAVVLLFMLGIMSIWTVGLFYVASEGACGFDNNRVVCEIGSNKAE